MNAKRFALISLFTGLMGLSMSSRAYDTDIYSSSASGGTMTPNMMFVLDSSANSDSNFGGCTYGPWDASHPPIMAESGGAPSLNGSKVLGNEQCALANIVHDLPTRTVTDPSTGVTSQVAYINLGIVTASEGLLVPLIPIDDNPFNGGVATTLGAAAIPAGSTNRRAFILAVMNGYAKHTGAVVQGAEMQEVWAYYTGGNAGASGVANNTGSISGRVFTSGGGVAASGCMNNYVTYIGASPPAAHALTSDGTAPLNLLTAVNNDRVNNIISAATATTLSTQFNATINPENPWGPEWARFMYSTDINTGATGTQKITTYTVNLQGGNASMSTYWTNMARYGGGKSFSATDYNTLVSSILKILNEVQAVNSVFSSSSLPVSVNAQGTFLNQIFMGMFRPDASGNPRWVGNLKQYQFIYDPTMGLQLGDSLGLAAISSAGTGFISANAVSFWTCTNLGSIGGSIVDPYIGLHVTAAQKTLMIGNHQDCPDTTSYPNLLPNGFWTADPSSTTAAAVGFDLPDGERVERGGAAEQIRISHLIDNYATAAGTSTNSRRLYTWCPTGTSCIAALTDPSNEFSLANAGITAALFGASTPITVSSIVRTGTTALVTTAIPHGFPVGTPLTVYITGAVQNEYNVTQTVTPTSTTQFTITGLPDNPPTPATGTYTASLHGFNAPKTISSMSVATSATANVNRCTSGTIPNINCNTVTVTLTGHGYNTNDNITIAGVGPAEYSGTFAITRIDNNTFTYNVPVTPTSPSVNAYSAQLPAPAAKSITNISKSGSTFTVTATAHGFSIGQSVTISGNSVAAYNTTWTVLSAATNTFTIGASGNPGTGTGGSAILNQPVIPIAAGNISRASATATTATATGITASAFSNGQTVNLAYVSGAGINENAYAPLSGNNSVVITCSGTCTSFTFPITSVPSTSTLTLTSPTATKLGSLVSITITRGGTTATATGLGVGAFNNNSIVDITSPDAPSNMSSYLSPAAGWTITCAASPCVGSFTFGPVTLSPATSATGSPRVTGGSTPPDRTTLINWMRGADNVGDEYSVCPNGNTAAPCPAATAGQPVVTIRPSVHGDVLHARPTVLNYGYHTIAITGTSDSGAVRTASVSAADANAIKLSGASPIVSFANGAACVVTVNSTTTFTYQNTLCGDAGAQSAAVGSKVVVYYGDNGGVFHAINGNLAEFIGSAGPGDELWGFIPSDFFGRLGRLMSNSPGVLMASTPPGITPTPTLKDFFVDGEPGIYQSIDGNGNTTKAVIYMAMRRGGNFIYALDVTNPVSPFFLWKIDSSGFTNSSGFIVETDFSELGQTWSQPKVARVAGYCNNAAAATPAACSSTNKPSPVVIFGAGYDANEDSEPITTMDGSGRGIFIVDALTGAKVWSATRSAGATSYTGTTTKATALIAGMNYSISSAITLVDRDSDGLIDRLYAADTGGNIWRVDLEPNIGNTPDNWRVYRLAALGGWSGPCGSTPCNPTQRKFFYPPEMIPATATHNHDSVIAGSGDREHPLYSSYSGGTQRYNRLFLIKDPATGNDASGVTTYPVTLGGTNALFDAGTYSAPTPWDGTLNGYFITLGAAEKVVNAPLVVAGYAYMSTNQPAPPSANSCTANLGTAYGYKLSPFSGAIGRVAFEGGGLPPSPVAGIVDIAIGGVVKHVPFLIGGGNPSSSCVGDCKSALGGQKPPITVQTNRTRTYWYKE